MATTLEGSQPAAKTTGPVCRHCGAPSVGEFCCTGCAYVFRLVHEEGLEAYYKIKDSVIPPADVALSPARDFNWLASAQAEAERLAGDATPQLVLDIQGISCAGCVWLIERLFRKTEGSSRIEINAQTGQLRLTWQKGTFDAAGFGRLLQQFNYLLGPATAARSAPGESRGLVRRIGLCAAFTMNIMLFALPAYFGMEPTYEYAPLFGTLAMGLATLSVLVGGGYFFKRAAASLQTGLLSIDLPIALGIAGSYAGSLAGWLLNREEYVYFDFVGTFVLLMLVGRWAQVAAVERNQRRLLAEQPLATALQIEAAGGGRRDVLPDALREGMRFWMRSGQSVPVRATLDSGDAEFSLAWINGESAPRLYQRGQSVPAGAQLLTRGEVTFVAKQGWGGSLLQALSQATSRGEFRHRMIERIVQGYLIAVFVVATGAAIGWVSLTGDWLRTGAVVTAILVVSCPCAIGLAFPLADEIATVRLRRSGVFVRAHDLWPKLARVRTVLFDKTGTLTLETPQLANPTALSSLSAHEKDVLYSLVHDNPHPVGRAIADALLAEDRREVLPGDVREEVGSGVSLTVDGCEWTLGKAAWKATSGEPTAGGTAFRKDGVLVANFVFSEAVRDDARAEIAALRRRGLEVGILSGDSSEKVDTIAALLGVEKRLVRGDLSPEDKARHVSAAGDDRTLMLGDGANDSLAFDRAFCRGTPVVHRGLLEQKADFYYLGRGISGIRALLEVDDIRRRTQRWLLVFSVAYNFAAVGLAVAGRMNPLLAAVMMPASSLASLALVGWGMRFGRSPDRSRTADLNAG
ncbi:heavy metal translocating P-type ATPase [Nibricoccus sp. IMCC34717]|uniref:heavy metal translocating P-type ATPase n=1 Tax=Nibricoccus sp. IMCC34717 TaxID=3034021 RepID=UPI00384BD581